MYTSRIVFLALIRVNSSFVEGRNPDKYASFNKLEHFLQRIRTKDEITRHNIHIRSSIFISIECICLVSVMAKLKQRCCSVTFFVSVVMPERSLNYIAHAIKLFLPSNSIGFFCTVNFLKSAKSIRPCRRRGFSPGLLLSHDEG